MTKYGFRTGGRGQIWTITAVVGLVVVLEGNDSSRGLPQGPAAQGRPTLTIPYLSNTTRPADLDFTAAQCDQVQNGEMMTCRFRQVFLTTSSVDPTSCVITTNGYERMFRRETSTRWVSHSVPSGDCGVVETTTLEDGGGTRWVMTIRTAATLRLDRPECLAASRELEAYDWRNMKRNLPCTSIQPGAIER